MPKAWVPFTEDERNKCPKCLTAKFARVENKNSMWGDGDVVCSMCGTYIRMWDSG